MSDADDLLGGSKLRREMQKLGEFRQKVSQSMETSRLSAIEVLDAQRDREAAEHARQVAADEQAESDRRAQIAKLGELADATTSVVRATTEVQKATLDVQAAVRRLADETDRSQRLAMWVAVGTGLGGAVLGGFAGALAARLVGN